MMRCPRAPSPASCTFNFIYISLYIYVQVDINTNFKYRYRLWWTRDADKMPVPRTKPRHPFGAGLMNITLYIYVHLSTYTYVHLNASNIASFLSTSCADDSTSFSLTNKSRRIKPAKYRIQQNDTDLFICILYEKGQSIFARTQVFQVEIQR